MQGCLLAILTVFVSSTLLYRFSPLRAELKQPAVHEDKQRLLGQIEFEGGMLWTPWNPSAVE